MSSQAYDDTFIEHFTPKSSATKRVFLPSSSPLSSLFGSKRAKRILQAPDIIAAVSTSNGSQPVAGNEALMECIFAGVDHSDGALRI